MEVPVVEKFEDIYPADAQEAQKKRWNNLLSSFEQNYNEKADFVARSPGRVNIIGEVRFIGFTELRVQRLTQVKVAHRLLPVSVPADGHYSRRITCSQNTQRRS